MGVDQPGRALGEVDDVEAEVDHHQVQQVEEEQRVVQVELADRALCADDGL